MPNFTCTECKRRSYLSESNYNDTIQCEECSKILKVRVKDNKVVNVRAHTIDLEIPEGLPESLDQILDESVSCYEVGCYSASVVMSGLFVEGALREADISGSRLVDMINNAKESGKITQLSYHMATASRMLRNTGAHYSEELSKISDSEARLTLEMARKLVIDLMDSEAL
ncbi:DUF4145 domain-containing protein [Photobacterium leiognathi]|uniref:DUF4145 domain-containing protein n=1 Tax=Photobacterium leiognathi TaxID=553611 RepID=UPI002982B5FA|nr:DUF4145 domain-containing protein [Photobacterium leiognathi]